MTTADRREQERSRRKQEILQAARAVFAEHGFGRATVDAVAQRAEVGKGTIYLYFENKEAILAELTLQALADLTGQLQAASDGCSVLHPDRRLRALADAYLAFSQKAPDYYRLLNAYNHGGFQQGISADMREQIVRESNRTLDLVTQAITDGIALGLFAPGDPRQLAGVLWAGLNGALALVSHPIRRTLVATDEPGLYHATLEVCLRGLGKGQA
ncbi:MAG: TetR/AcrR family transcriptional regulator [Chloroflexi bacterium]|nr:TetR/AcrR family transcriptional regulator [Chloroflexota bacterium]